MSERSAILSVVRTPRLNMRAWVLDLIAIAVMSVYGTYVCPYLDGLGLPQVALSFALGILSTHVLFAAALRGRALSATGVYTHTLVRFWVAACGIATYNYVVYGFPSGSTLKVILGTAALAHFIAVDLAIDRSMRSPSPVEELGGGRSISRRYVAFAGVGALLALLIVGLVVRRDLYWLASAEGGAEQAYVVRVLASEMIFIGAVLAALFINLAYGLSRALQAFSETHMELLDRVAQGELEELAPVPQEVRLGRLTERANEMVTRLRQASRRRALFGGELRSAATDLLALAPGASVHGFTLDATVLVIRIGLWGTESNGLTTLNELSSRLTSGSKILDDAGAITLRFAGDGLLALFVDSESASPRNLRAVLAARSLASKLGGSGQASIGVATGEVLAGIVGTGADARFTCVGPTVNRAAELSRSSRDAVRMRISSEVHAQLDELERRRWGPSSDGDGHSPTKTRAGDPTLEL